MAWQIKLSKEADKALDKLDPSVARRILRFLYERVATLEDPRNIGESLKGSQLGQFWKYRVGDYRVISHIEDGELCILVVRIGNRRDVYRQK